MHAGSHPGWSVLAAAVTWLALPTALAGGLDVLSGHASTHVVVQVQRGVTPGALADGRLTLLAGPDTVLVGAGGPSAALAGTLERWQATDVRPLFEAGLAYRRVARRLGLDRYYRVHVPPGTDTPRLAAALARHDTLIARAEPDGIGGIAGTMPDDPDFGLQWGLLNTGQVIDGEPGAPGADINVIPAWTLGTGDPDLVLAVLDAGMDPHEELLGRMVPGRNVAADPDNDDTSDVCISHGTHVAGLAAAAANNALGVAGVDWNCRIMPVRVLNSCGGPESFVAEGIVWATDHGADVINMSLQYFDGLTGLQMAVQYAHATGVAMIVASGNQGASQVAFPAFWPQTIAVGAITNRGERWNLSNGGPNLDVMGPGVDIWSLKGTTEYQFLSGTSMATPHVSGTVCLLKAHVPGLAPDTLGQILRASAVDLDVPGFDPGTGFGRIDAAAAVASLPVPGDLDGNGVVNTNDLLILLGSWGPCPEPCPPTCSADLDDDCTVGTADLLVLLASWS